MNHRIAKAAGQQDHRDGGTGKRQHGRPHGKRADSPCLVLKIQGSVRYLTPDELQDDETVNELREQCIQANVPVEVSLANLLNQSPATRVGCLDLIASLTCRCRFHPIRNAKQTYNEPLLAILSLMVPPSDLDRYERAKSAALEWAVIRYPAALEGPCQQIVARLRELGVRGCGLRELLRDAREIQRSLGHGATVQPSTSVQSVFEDAPVSEGIVVPVGWSLSPGGIRRGGERRGDFIPAPVLITARHVDINGDSESVTLAWRRDGAWHQYTAERSIIASSRNIVDELAAFGGPANSNNAKELVQYLADFETANLAHLPVTRVSRQLGWQGDGHGAGFLCGKTLIAAESRPEKSNQTVCFCGADEGDDQIAAGFRKRGRFAKWRDAIAVIKPFPKARLALYTSFVPPLLTILKTRNFVLDFSGTTTVGKTTCLWLAASSWGDPDDNNPAGLVKTWDGTATYRERVPAVLNNLPFLLDDTKHARRPEDVAHTIYSVVQGQGRGRGSISGVARLATWHTVLFSTGEQPATSFTQDGGVRARVLSLWGSPFNAVNAETRKLVRRLSDRVKRHYGHAGPRVVQYLSDHRDQWGDWRKEYLEKVGEYESKAVNNQFAGRMATDFAAIAVAARIAHEALDLPWHFQDPIKPLWKELANEAAGADRAAAALRYVADWAHAHQEEFFGRAKYSRQPNNGWAGRWDSGKAVPGGEANDEKWSAINFFPARLRSLLQEGDFEPESTLRTWRDEKWLAVTKEKKRTRFEVKKRVGDTTPWLIAVKRTAIEQVRG